MFKGFSFNSVIESIKEHGENYAFCISGNFYTYNQFFQCIMKIRSNLSTLDKINKIVGLVDNDDLETYASIFALWLEGYAYVPLSKDFPKARLNNIISQANINYVLASSDNKEVKYDKCEVVNTKDIFVVNQENYLNKSDCSGNDLAYMLFTSGTTGTPKGVPITRNNLLAFLDAFNDLNINLKNNDKCLQMFNLTFDLSVVSYLIPLLKGACVYTIPKNEIKYNYIFSLLDEHKLTFTLMVPSVLQYLKPYFDEMNFTSVNYSLFAGEGLNVDLISEWKISVPNAKILNLYGPTEHTIFCTQLECGVITKSYNGVYSIGKQIGDTSLVILDDNNQIINNRDKGELCLSGNQMTNGYWKNETKNQEAFINLNIDGTTKKFYKTGDLCFKDENGYVFYIGRKDFQAKIQGFRVELSEIEFYIRKYFKNINIAVVAINNKINNTEIALVIESSEIDLTGLFKFLDKNLPKYMIPTQIKFLDKIPLNTNGKVDKKIIKEIFK